MQITNGPKTNYLWPGATTMWNAKICSSLRERLSSWCASWSIPPHHSLVIVLALKWKKKPKRITVTMGLSSGGGTPVCSESCKAKVECRYNKHWMNDGIDDMECLNSFRESRGIRCRLDYKQTNVYVDSHKTGNKGQNKTYWGPVAFRWYTDLFV